MQAGQCRRDTGRHQADTRFAPALLRGIIVYRNRHQADTGPGALEDLARYPPGSFGNLG